MLGTRCTCSCTLRDTYEIALRLLTYNAFHNISYSSHVQYVPLPQCLILLYRCKHFSHKLRINQLSFISFSD